LPPLARRRVETLEVLVMIEARAGEGERAQTPTTGAQVIFSLDVRMGSELSAAHVFIFVIQETSMR